MKYTKGQSGNPAGRPKGAKNKAGAELRLRIGDFLTENFERLEADFHEMLPQDRLRMFAMLLPYCIGKKQELSIAGQLGSLKEEDLNEILEFLNDKAESHE